LDEPRAYFDQEGEVDIFRLPVIAAVAALVLLSGGSLEAQQIGGVGKGERVRVTYESSGQRVIVGLLHDVQETAFLVAPTAGGIVPIPRDQVTDFRVLRGQQREWKKGLVRGALAGALTGMLMSAFLTDVFESGGWEVEDSGGQLFAYGLVGAAYGGAIGTGIGLFFKKDRWETVAFRGSVPSLSKSSVERFSFGLTIPLGR
jgi:hypothetical protein